MSDKKQETTQKALRRLSVIRGQLNGLYRMVQDDEYCIDILNQSLAIQNSLKSVDAIILERHLHTHVANQFKSEEPEKVIKELLKVFKRSNKGR